MCGLIWQRSDSRDGLACASLAWLQLAHELRLAIELGGIAVLELVQVLLWREAVLDCVVRSGDMQLALQAAAKGSK